MCLFSAQGLDVRIAVVILELARMVLQFGDVFLAKSEICNAWLSDDTRCRVFQSDL